jgi:ribonuclease P protein component
MLPELRLRRSDDFQRLRREGRSYPNRLLLMSILPNMLSHNRYGFIVSKQLGSAVRRNRIRRQVREAVRLLHPQLRTGYDIVFIARSLVVEQPFEMVQRTIVDLVWQAGLWEG